jgi:hypothetical protein
MFIRPLHSEIGGKEAGHGKYFTLLPSVARGEYMQSKAKRETRKGNGHSSGEGAVAQLRDEVTLLAKSPISKCPNSDMWNEGVEHTDGKTADPNRSFIFSNDASGQGCPSRLRVCKKQPRTAKRTRMRSNMAYAYSRNERKPRDHYPTDSKGGQHFGEPQPLRSS